MTHVANSTVPATQSILQIDADALSPDLNAIREPILQWVELKHGAPLPVLAGSGQIFETTPAQGSSVQALSHPNPFVWALRLIDPDEKVPGRDWITEVGLFAAGSGFRLAVRLSCSASVEAEEFVPRSPSFVRKLAEGVGLSCGEQPIATTARAINSETDVEDLVKEMRNGQRRLPIIVVSAPSDGTDFLIDPAQLAESLVGVATVYCISYNAALSLTRKVGKQWSVFLGACRVYTAYSDTKSPYDDTLLFAAQITGAAAGWGMGRLRHEVARISLRRDDLYRLLPQFDKLQADVKGREIEQRPQAAGAPGPPVILPLPENEMPRLDAQASLELLRDMEQRALRQNEASKRDAEIALQLAHECEQQAVQARRELEAAKEQHDAAQSRIKQLEATLRSAGLPIPPEPPPYWYGGLAEWAERNFAGRLVLSKRAQKAVEDSDYADIDLVCDGLALLANEYVDMRRAGGGRDQYEKRLAELRLGDERIAANTQRLRNDSQYWCSYEGRDIFTDRHLKKGTSRDPRECLRIYFSWDEPTKQVIIGHLTSHLETEIT